MVKTMLLPIIYLLSYLSKGPPKVKDNYREKININFQLEDADSIKISVLSFLIQHRNPLRND